MLVSSVSCEPACRRAVMQTHLPYCPTSPSVSCVRSMSNRAVYEIARAHSKLKLRSRLIISVIGCLANLVDAAKAATKPDKRNKPRRPSRYASSTSTTFFVAYNGMAVWAGTP